MICILQVAVHKYPAYIAAFSLQRDERWENRLRTDKRDDDYVIIGTLIINFKGFSYLKLMP